MSTFSYIVMLPLILIAMLVAMVEMGNALDEADVEGFSIWMGVAALFAGLPLVL